MNNNKKKQGKLKAFFASRKTRKGAFAVVILAVALAVVILLNVVTGLLVQRFPNLMFDMTSSGTYRLQKDTTEYIKQLDKDITINVMVSAKRFKSGIDGMYSGTEYFVQAQELLKKMAAQSDHITLKYIDLSTNPTFKSKFEDIDWNSSDSSTLIVVEQGDEYTALDIDQCFTIDSTYASYYGYSTCTATTIEEAVVTGMLDVTSGDKVLIDFITGSGENEDNYSALVSLLEKNAYEVKEVNLLTGELSEDSEIAFLYAPTVDLSQDDIDKVETWLRNDDEFGKSLVYIPINDNIKTPNIDTLVEKYGMKISNGLAYCTNEQYAINNYYTFITDYNNDTYTKDLKNPDIPVIVSDTRDIEITDTSSASPLLSVEASAGMIPFNKMTEDASADDYMKADGVNIAAIGSMSGEDEKTSNVVVFGSMNMFTSVYLESSGNNSEYIVNLCNTVTNRGDMGVTITSASVDSSELGTVTNGVIIIVGIIFIGVIPIIVLLVGLIVFIRRRLR